MNMVWVDSLPTEIDLPIVCRLGLLEGEEMDLRIELLGPGMTLLGELDTPFVGEPPAGHQPEDEIAIMQPLHLRFEAITAGTHCADIRADNRHQTSVFWVVRVGDPAS